MRQYEQQKSIGKDEAGTDYITVVKHVIGEATKEENKPNENNTGTFSFSDRCQYENIDSIDACNDCKYLIGRHYP